MAEIIASIAGIATAAIVTSKKLYELVDDVKEGPEEIGHIARDAHAFYSIVFSLQLALKEEDIRSIVRDDAAILQMIQNLQRPLTNCETVLGKIRAKIERHLKPHPRGFRMSSIDLKWGLITKSEIKDLLRKLEATKSTLDNALAAVTT